ncbi:MAG: TonB-dependent receptor [Gemmatimonadaceae bacterium]|nr:TonB-dependent receptor [Gemmatimonadaceae bacterium]
MFDVRSYARSAGFALAALAAIPTILTAQGAVRGRVTGSDGAPVVGAYILLDSAIVPVAQADMSGRFTIAAFPAGPHTVTARRTGYLPGSVPVDAALRTDIDIVLEAAAPTTLGAVTVIGSRGDLAETRIHLQTIAGSVALIEPAAIRATRQANLSDVLRFTPGVYVQSRFGAADESQISVRGSGLRSNFHARGINLLVNGMPYRNADGFTDFESLELLTTEAIEVYKGANALRFGGSTLGGAINLDTKTGYTASPVSIFAEGGSFGYRKAQLSSGASAHGFDYYASYARTSLDGYRDWSANQRDRVNLHAGYRMSPSLDARAFYIFAHVQEHLPGSLTRTQLETDPRAADSTNFANRWGRDYDLHHLGVQLRAQLGATQRLDVSPYFQFRNIDHPIFEVISQISHDIGAEVRYETTTPLGGLENRLTIGVQPAWLSMQNRQYVNVRGEHGALTRDERDGVSTGAGYFEDALSVTPRLTLTAGGRYDRSSRRVADYFLSNGDQSDERVYSALTPRFGALYSVGVTQLFANASRTVEPPLLLELTSFGSQGGFNPLDAQDAWQYELGARRRGATLAWEVAAYDVELRGELVNLNIQPFPNAPFTVPTYRNVSRSRHRGVELGVAGELGRGIVARGAETDRITWQGSYTYARYEYVRDPDFAGHEIPGAPRHYASAQLTYVHPAGLSITPSIELAPVAYFVNSANTVTNEPWSNIGLRAEWTFASLGGSVFASARNLGDRVQSQSVQVDNAAGRYFEPSDRRTIYVGLRWAH